MYTRYKIVEFFSNFFAIVIEFAPKKKTKFSQFSCKKHNNFFPPKKDCTQHRFTHYGLFM